MPTPTTRRAALARRHRSSAVLLGLLLVAATACGSADEDDGGAAASSAASTSDEEPTIEDTDQPAATATEDAPTAAPAVDGATVEGPVGEQLAWVLELLGTEPGDVDVAEVEERFAEAFLAQVPPDQLVGLLPQLTDGTEGPWTATSGTFAGTEGSGTVTPTNGPALRVELVVAADEPHLIEGLRFLPAPPPPVSIAEVGQRLGALGTAGLGVYEVTDGACEPLHELAADQPLALGSSFKLWVLAALAEAVEAGDATWDEPLAVRPEWRSSPDGEVHELDDGDELTLRRHAELMISISDNTATDHLLHRLGREQVEAAMERSGVTDPPANVPMLSTAELFAIKFHPDPPSAEDYRELDTDGRRALLDELRDAVPPWVGVAPEDVEAEFGGAAALVEPRALDLEWFASPADLCATMLRLDELAATPGLEPVAQALSINPGEGLDLDRERFPEIRFKGGSEPGVLAANWWVQRADGRQFVVAGAVNNPDVAFPSDQAVLPLAATIDLLDDLAPSD